MFSRVVVKLQGYQQGICYWHVRRCVGGWGRGDSLNVPFGCCSHCYGHRNDESYATNMAEAIAIRHGWKSRYQIKTLNYPQRALWLPLTLKEAFKTGSLGGQRVKTPLLCNLADNQKWRSIWEPKGQIVHQNHIDSQQSCGEGLTVFKVRGTSSSM